MFQFGVNKMDGINKKLNDKIEDECKKHAAIEKAKQFVEIRRPRTRAKIQALKDWAQLEKDFE